MLFDGVRLCEASLGALRARGAWRLHACDLSGADLLGTSLAGQDLTECEIAGVRLAGGEVRGAVVTPAQACELAKLLGVVIR